MTIFSQLVPQICERLYINAILVRFLSKGLQRALNSVCGADDESTNEAANILSKNMPQ